MSPTVGDKTLDRTRSWNDLPVTIGSSGGLDYVSSKGGDQMNGFKNMSMALAYGLMFYVREVFSHS